MPKYRTFTRTWWKRNPNWPGGREPGPSRKRYDGCTFDTEDDAIRHCQEYNASHNPGPLSRKMEFERISPEV